MIDAPGKAPREPSVLGTDQRHLGHSANIVRDNDVGALGKIWRRILRRIVRRIWRTIWRTI